MLELILSPLLQVLFEKLASGGINRYLKKKKRLQLSKAIQEWQKTLRLIEAILSDAGQKQSNSNAVKLWLQDLRDLAYDLEDILDHFVTEARIIELRKNEWRKHSSRLSCFPFHNKVPGLFLTCGSRASNSKGNVRYSKIIEQTSHRLQDILTQAGSLGLSPQTHSREEWREERTRTSSLVCEPVIYGREDEKSEIIRRLVGDEACSENYIVISVVGKGGIGKTTLAQAVYNDDQVKAHFEIKAWVCVSDVFDVKQITTTVINSATQVTHSFNDLNEAHEKLKSLLSGKRFLIVLDDIWSDEYDPWDQLHTPFQAAARGSRVVITTRIERVAKNMLKRPTQSPITNLKALSDEDCWLLFQHHALVDDSLIKMQSEVVRLFKGLPLAAKALGGLLRKEDVSKWPKILKNNIWSEEGGVLPALRLSYHHLPQHLKRIFAYCSIFPKAHKFLDKDVVLMWMAEGLLPENNNNEKESMEDVGHSYFLELVSRSLFEPCPSPFRQGYFVMHDLIHDLAQWAAGDVCCTMDIHKVSSRTRYFSFAKEVLEGPPWNPEKVSQLRTFAFFGISYVVPVHMLDSSLRKLQYLRLLSMAHMGITEVPSSIGNLKHLRLLDLSFNRELKELPESTNKLCNLQTLLLKDCRLLRKVVTNIALLIELRHLDIEGTSLLEMPVGIGKLSNLRTLNGFILTVDSGPRISELKNLKCLHGSLNISDLQNVVRSEDAQEARLHEKSGLDVLRMFWGVSTHEVDHNIERDVLDQLQPQKSIKQLELNGYRALAFPIWLGNPSFTEMVVIRLNNCLRCESLPPLGLLPSLKKLSVERMSGIKTIGPEFYGVGCSNPFPALKSLRFEYMNLWEEWMPPSSDNSRGFSCLEEISISDCPLLRGCLPSHLPSLLILDILNCDEMHVSLPSNHLLRELKIDRCKELSSTTPVICCSDRIRIADTSQFTGIEGFWVQGVETLVVVDIDYLGEGTYHGKCLELVNCPKLHTWRLDLNEELDKLTHVAFGNCEQVVAFLENKFPSSLRHLTIHSDDSLKHISRLTNQSSCLEELHIEYCSSLNTIDNLPLTLQRLVIEDVDIQQPAKDWGLHLLTSLKYLRIVNAGSSVDSVESIPEPDLNLPSSLSELTIIGFKSLKYISFSNLPNLTHIWIEDCPLMCQIAHDTYGLFPMDL